MGEGCEYIYCTFLLFGIVIVEEIFAELCRHYPFRVGLVEDWLWQGWNHGVGGEVGVVPVIGQHLGLGCFGTVGWPRQHWHCSRSLGRPVFPFTILFAVFNTSCAWHLDVGYTTWDSLCFMHHIWRNSWNILEVKGWPPSVLSSSGVPYV